MVINAITTTLQFAVNGRMGVHAVPAQKSVHADIITLVMKRNLWKQARQGLLPLNIAKTAYEALLQYPIKMVQSQSIIQLNLPHVPQLPQELLWSRWPLNRDSPSRPPQGVTGMVQAIMKYPNAGDANAKRTP